MTPDTHDPEAAADRAAAAKSRLSQGGPPILPKRGIHFGTVAALNVGQCPTFGPESPLLWESSTLTVTQGRSVPHRCTEVDSPLAEYALAPAGLVEGPVTVTH